MTCFNPRTRVGCDADKFYIAPPNGVSIHAPVWGATFLLASQLSLSRFQSTHPCGVRPNCKLNQRSRLWFQSTHPCGVRHLHKFYWSMHNVSIHAPVWGATLLSMVVLPVVSFNPRTRVGCDNQHLKNPVRLVCFNPRTRVGCDWRFLLAWAHNMGFNPRTRVGCDISVKTYAKMFDVSIHAPVWGATGKFGMSSKKQAFQSTHPCGVRRLA